MERAYSGELHENKMHGKGRLVSRQNGVREVFHGNFENDLYHGQGQLYRCNADGTKSFEATGVFAYGKIVDGIGIGRNTKLNRVIKSSYQNSLLNTSKVEVFCGKDRYKGGFNFKTEQFNGFGEHFFGDDILIHYRGTFSDGKYHGYGRLRYLHPGTYCVLFKYKGGFLHGKFHGRGTLHKKNEEVYEGEFKDDLYEGHGYLQRFSNHDVQEWYIGSFRKGLYHGFGMLCHHEKGFTEGIFKEGNFHQNLLS